MAVCALRCAQLTTANVRGEAGLGFADKSTSFARVSLPRAAHVCALAAGLDHVLVLAEADGAQYLWTCGRTCLVNYTYTVNTDGQLGDNGHSTFVRTLQPVHVPLDDGERIARVAAGGDTSAVLSDRGRLWVWGNTEYGQGLQSRAADQLTAPTLAFIPGAPRITNVLLGGSYILLLDGTYGTLR